MKLSPQCRTSFHTRLEMNPNDRPLTLQIQPNNMLNYIKIYVCLCVCLCAQSCPTLCDPRQAPGLQPARLLCPFLGKKTGVGCHFLLQCRKEKVKLLSRVRLVATPWAAAYQAPPSMGFSRREYWSGTCIYTYVHIYRLPLEPPPTHLGHHRAVS